ncbi:hypothetical protein INT48_001605 [Thamnidium elegans]|uniref:Uncharacterized protein n=1 Tax=Thamnidium elegans TaxID=101142 RepID=A0A8H7SSE0_9FUNG|nr:hypothetical protein INT48_001605 [Thamnidium elegans]
MVTSSRFQEHFDFIEQDLFQTSSTSTFYNGSSNTSNTSYTSPHLYMDQEYDTRRQSLSNTIETISSQATNSINGQCSLRRQSRVRTRHQRENSNGSSLTSNVSHNPIIGWCLRQKSKFSSKLRHL